MKKILTLTLCFTFTSILFAFGNKELVIDAEEKIIVALILDENGIGDDSVNDSCYLGLQQAADEGLVTLRVKSAKTPEETLEHLESFVSNGVNALFLIGDTNKDLLLKSATKHTDTQFFGVDIIFSETELKENLIGITFKEQDGGYLAGLLAGSLTYKYQKYHEYLNETNRVGIILGKNSPDIKRYELGFYAGVKEVNPPCEIISININNLDDPEKAEAALIELKEKGVDIVFSVAGNSDSGVFKAAEDHNVLIIGANKDFSERSTNILTSVVKKISVSTYLMTSEYVTNGLIVGENKIYGLNEGAISLAPYYNFDRFIPKDLRELMSKMSIKLIKGSKVIPNSIEEIIFDVEKVPEIVE